MFIWTEKAIINATHIETVYTEERDGKWVLIAATTSGTRYIFGECDTMEVASDEIRKLLTTFNRNERQRERCQK